jgi:hypothetical protein
VQELEMILLQLLLKEILGELEMEQNQDLEIEVAAVAVEPVLWVQRQLHHK